MNACDSGHTKGAPRRDSLLLLGSGVKFSAFVCFGGGGRSLGRHFGTLADYANTIRTQRVLGARHINTTPCFEDKFIIAEIVQK